MSVQSKNHKNAKATLIRVVCLVVAVLMIFSVVAGALWS